MFFFFLILWVSPQIHLLLHMHTPIRNVFPLEEPTHSFRLRHAKNLLWARRKKQRHERQNSNKNHIATFSSSLAEKKFQIQNCILQMLNFSLTENHRLTTQRKHGFDFLYCYSSIPELSLDRVPLINLIIWTNLLKAKSEKKNVLLWNLYSQKKGVD